jgi:HD superfamily phosphohydrolase
LTDSPSRRPSVARGLTPHYRAVHDSAAEAPALSLTVGQRVSDIYTILDRDDPDTVPKTQTGKAAKPLGQGGSGTVYLASYREMQKRAIKFLTLNYLSGDTGKRPSDFEKSFNRERVFLSTLSNGNIARLYDTGAFEDERGIAWQYIVTDYIDGDELLPALEGAESADQIYNAISDVLRAISYMHSKRVLHADIKWQNIKCRKTPTGLESVILDLGTAHHIPPDNGDGAELPFDEASATRVRFITTKRITHTRHRQYRNDIVDKETLRQLFPLHDLHAIGVLLDELVQNLKVKQNLRHVVGDEGLQALDTMIYCLRNCPEKEPSSDRPDYRRVIQYVDIQQVYRDWQKLRRTYLAPVNVPELSLAAEFKYSVPTAAGRGVVTPRLAVLINHKLFQRLRRVPQLEMTLMKFPGATHTRFSHSLAVMRNTRYYLAHLLNDPSFLLLCEPADLQATILLALLHDVGHYQLVHMFEDYASDQRGAKDDQPWKDIDFDIPSDDDLFWSIIDPSGSSRLRGNYGLLIEEAWRNSEARLNLSRAPTFKELICDQFDEATYEAMRRIHNAVYSPDSYTAPTAAQLVLGAVLSSDIDADKVAYLIEDAARSGVNYGSGVDFDGILGALRMPDLHDVGKRPTLGITQKGLAAAQSVVVSRNLMVGQVYWQHTNRAATAMVKYVIARMLKRGVLKVPEYIGATLFLEYEAALTYLFNMFEEMRAEEEATDVNPIAGLIEGERRIYDTAFSTSRLEREEGEVIAGALTKKSFDGIITLEKRLTKIVRDVSKLPDLKEGEVLVDVPVKERERSSGDHGGRVMVYRTRTERSGVLLRDYTPFLVAVKEEHFRENRVCRVFVSPRVAASENYGAVMAAVSEDIRNEYGKD